ncbi:c-type cytochrome [Rhodovulum iodosum]|nr:c-type cytochrome [Rhodovulum robiginosum]
MVGGLLLVCGIAAFGWIWGVATSDADDGALAPDLARGQAIYAQACASCHGAALEGQIDWRSRGPDGRLPAPPHDATGHTWHHSDRVLLDITMRGTAAVVGGGYESNMPGFADIYSEDELRDVLEWIKTQWPERERVHQAQVTARDEAAR